MIPKLRRQDGMCPKNGGNWYACNGFRGCCLIDPCLPGSTCPVDKDTTPGRSSDITSQISSASFKTTKTALPSATSTSASTTTSAAASTSSTSSADDSFTVSLVQPNSTAFRTVTQSMWGTTTPSAVTPAPISHAHSAPIAAIVGAALGTIILIALAISVLLCIRKKRRTKTYKAPAYPSPLVGSDMTPQLSSKASSQFQQKVAALYRADTVAERHDPQQLDSREIGRRDDRRHGSISRYAELPAEPLPWPGNSGGN